MENKRFNEIIDDNFLYIVIIVNILIIFSQVMYDISHEIEISIHNYGTSLSSIGFFQIFPVVLITPIIQVLVEKEEPNIDFLRTSLGGAYMSFTWGVGIVIINCILLITTIHSQSYAFYIGILSLSLSWLYYHIIVIYYDKKEKESGVDNSIEEPRY